MRLHVWTDDDPPPVINLTDDYVQILDYPFWVGYEVGDQIQYMTEVGTNVYFVTDVQPEIDIGGLGTEMRRVTLEAAVW
jgi:hypothetical protein